jgi:hypothetical protein
VAPQQSLDDPAVFEEYDNVEDLDDSGEAPGQQEDHDEQHHPHDIEA